MVAEPKPKAARKKKRRRAPREEYVDYIVEIEDWDWGYAYPDKITGRLGIPAFQAAAARVNSPKAVCFATSASASESKQQNPCRPDDFAR
jgi:hypothetical protein